MKRSAVVFVNGSDVKDLVPIKSSELRNALSAFSKGSKVVLVLKSYYREKQLSQLNVFFAYSTYIASQTGHNRKEIEHTLLEKYGLWTAKLDSKRDVVFDQHGNAVFIPKSLRDYNYHEMSELLDKIHGSMRDDFGISMPDPKSYSKINFEL